MTDLVNLQTKLLYANENKLYLHKIIPFGGYHTYHGERLRIFLRYKDKEDRTIMSNNLSEEDSQPFNDK